VVKIHKLNTSNLIILFSILLVILLLFNSIFTVGLSSKYNNLIEFAKEEARPSNLEIIKIKAPSDCSNCFNLLPVINDLKSKNVNIINEKELNLNDAQDLISKYNIKKLPTFILKGEINRTNLGENYLETEDVVIFNALEPVYYDAELNQQIGLVKATIIKPDNCEKCFDLDSVLEQIKSLNVFIEKEEILTEIEGAELIKKYNLQKLPVLILSEDFKAYESSSVIWEKLNGELDNSGNFLLRDVLPPFKDLKTKEIKGLVNVKYLSDKSCTECYNVIVHKNILGNFGIIPIKEETIDISSEEGKKLKDLYKIVKVPTVIISKEAADYQSFEEIFLQVGTKEKDNTYIFRKAEIMGTYKDLEQNKVIEPVKGK